FILEDDERHEFWSMNEGIIKKLIQKYIVIAGHEYLLKKEWVLQYHVPFLQGNVWGDYVRDTINLLGQLFFFEYIVIRKIVGIEDITTPAGSFIEAYKLDFFEKFTLNDETEIYQGTEWFAPNVGLVKKIINGEEEVLIEYKITNK
ncbi:MAG: hypothetical protein NZ601_04020, partial [candidate division WOR-3 bacterium]|nr:hypothetical protein [candidate division WOR-3 bacterium]